MPPASGITEPELANGESPDYYRKMDRRLIVLETRFDIILPTLATKADLIGLKAELRAEMSELRTEIRAMHGELKAEMQKLKADMQKWMIATLISFFTGFGGLLVALVTLLRPG